MGKLNQVRLHSKALAFTVRKVVVKKEPLNVSQIKRSVSDGPPAKINDENAATNPNKNTNPQSSSTSENTEVNFGANAKSSQNQPLETLNGGLRRSNRKIRIPDRDSIMDLILTSPPKMRRRRGRPAKNTNQKQTKKPVRKRAVKPPKPSRYTCQLCPMVLQTDGEQKMHLEMHEGQRPYLCPNFPDCPWAYEDEVKLIEHYSNKHSKEAIFVCEFCKKEYKYQRTLNNHLNSKHPSNSNNL